MKFKNLPAYIQDPVAKNGKIVIDRTNYKVVNKFGFNSDIDTGTVPEDIWALGGLYSFTVTASVLSIVSSSTDDAAAGTGARTITIEGVDANRMELIETVTLNGTTPVLTTNEFLRVNRAYNVTAGSNEVNVGNITIQDDRPISIGYIGAGQGQTLLGLFTIPKDYQRAFLCSIYTDIVRSGTADVEVNFRVREEDGAWRTRDVLGSNQSNSNELFSELAPGSDMIMRVVSATANNSGVTGRFTLLLAKN